MNYLLYILVALMPFIITDSLWDYSNLPKTLWVQNGVILLAVVFFWTRKFRKWDISVSKALIAYMVFLAWAGLSIFWAINKYEAVVVFTHWAMCGLFLFLVQNMNINKTVIFVTVFLTAWIVALIGLGQHFFHLDWVLQSERPASTFGNCNGAGAYILMAMPLGVAIMVLSYQSKQWVWIGILSLAMATMLTFIYVATFRTAMVAIVVIGSYYLVKYLRRKDYALIVVVLIGLFMAVSLYVKPEFFHEPGKIKRLWNTAEIIKEHPIVGVGVGNFKVHYDKYSRLKVNTNDAHNDYVQMLCELGIVGLYLAFLVVVYAFRGMLKKCDLHSTALKAGLAAFLILAIFTFPMAMATEPFIAALYLGMLKV